MSSAIQDMWASNIPQDNVTSVSVGANKENIAPEATNTTLSVLNNYEDSRITALRIFIDTISEWKISPRTLGVYEWEGHRFTIQSAVEYIEYQRGITSGLREERYKHEKESIQFQKELLKANESVKMLTVQNRLLMEAKKVQVREVEHTDHKRNRRDISELLIGSENEIGDSISGSTSEDDKPKTKKIKGD